MTVLFVSRIMCVGQPSELAMGGRMPTKYAEWVYMDPDRECDCRHFIDIGTILEGWDFHRPKFE